MNFIKYFALFFTPFIMFSACSLSGNKTPISYTPENFSFSELQDQVKKTEISLEVATLAGGCFWCMEAPFEKISGIKGVFSGYAGGNAENAEYKKVSSGKTGHREAIQVFFDPQKISYEKILDIFSHQINPTDASGQFADRGFQYTTAIFFHSEEQKKSAQKLIVSLENSGKFSEKIVVPILPFSTFFPAEDYHQDYAQKHYDSYFRYKKASGRYDYIHENWGNELKSDKKLEISDHSQEKFMNKKQNLTDLQFQVTQKNGTERPFDNEYWDNKRDGIYTDIVSGEVLFSSQDKFKSGTGWPSFTTFLGEGSGNIVEKRDTSLFADRVEVRSKNADSHLGHVFTDGPQDKGGLRYCINSAAMNFIPAEDLQTFENGRYAKYSELFHK